MSFYYYYICGLQPQDDSLMTSLGVIYSSGATEDIIHLFSAVIFTLTQGAKGGVLHLPCCQRLATRNNIYDPVGTQPIWTTWPIFCWKSKMAASILAPYQNIAWR